MGTHPNAMMIAVITPDEGTRKTQRMIFKHCEERGIKFDEDDNSISIPNGNKGAVSEEYPDGYPLTDDWSLVVMECDYHENWQISAKEGQIVIHSFITYGYGDNTEWADVEYKKKQLEELINPMCEPLKLSYKIMITANYW